MRHIGTLPHENLANRFSRFLTHQGIGNHCDVVFDPATGQMTYQIWILEEDKVQQAAALFEEFVKKPANLQFDAPEPDPFPDKPQEEIAPVRRFGTHLTHFFIGLCALIFFLNLLQMSELKKMSPADQTPLTPLMALLIFDLPPALASNANSETPYWKGLYSWTLAKIRSEDPSSGKGPLFTKIREGEVWRLVSPCILHKDLLHILFNMLWLWYLGKPIEQRIGPLRTLILSIIVGVGSNTLQYLMSGPLFIGYSGVITGLAGFIWMRERIAPWEGYPLNRATIFFLLIFIVAIFALQVISFFVQIVSSYPFAPNIANTAHIAGAVIGALLGKWPFFAQRVKT